MAEARDVDLKAWLDGFAFHPANTRLKQLGHNIARQLVANVAGILHAMLPAGREKSLVFTHLELVLMYANKALAVGGGPRPTFSHEEAQELAYLEQVNDSLIREGEAFGATLQQDPRIKEYEAQQRGDAPGPLDALPFPVPQAVKDQAAAPAEPRGAALAELGPFAPFEYRTGGEGGPEQTYFLQVEAAEEPYAYLSLRDDDEGENKHDAVELRITDPDVLHAMAVNHSAAANLLARLRG